MRVLTPIITVLAVLCVYSSVAQARIVKCVQKNDQWQMTVDGKPYYVKGAGGHVQQKKLVEIGGNTIRTWGADDAKAILDEAQSNGLMVMMGLWVQHERHGFDYDDPIKVKTQLENFRKVVSELKDHPALLIWGVGNEVDLFYKNTNVWYAVEDIAKMIKELDPNHPTCTVTAGFDPVETALLIERCPSIDIYGINTYGDIGNVKDGLKKTAWNKPYMITEWGPNGHWEVQKASWGAPIEQSSHEKALSYYERYTKYIAGDPDKCIGSFVFLWGQKQETTSTWYGLFSETGESSEAIDVLHRIWREKSGENESPVIEPSKLNGGGKSDNVEVVAGDKCEAILTALDPNNDKLKIVVQVIPESTDIKAGGDVEAAPLPLSGLGMRIKGNQAKFYAPGNPGQYRLFIFIYDGKGGYAYENIPFLVKPRPADAPLARPISFKRYQMTFE
ncbi:MAG: hypothetical protein RLZZ262_682 [Bacteroidota bacterium]|jgi:hypothetical protein